MSLELMRKWVASLPPAERNLPLLHVGNAFYSPEQALYEVERGTAVGEQLQKLVEEGRFGTNLTALAKARLEALLKREDFKIGTLSGAVVSTKQLAKMIQEGDLNNPIVQVLMAADIKVAEQMLKKGKELAQGGGSGEPQTAQ